MGTIGFDYIIVNQSNIGVFKSLLSGGTTLEDSGLPMGYSDGDVSGTTEIPSTSVVINGTSPSRLSELRKYTITIVFADQYVGGGNYSSDGVDYNFSNENESIIYYIGGIQYIDTIVDGITIGTTFTFTGQGYNSPNFINRPIYKNPNKENIISNPKIYDDVFIIRQELSAFDKNYRLEYMKSLIDLETYAGGNFFNINNNT